MESKKYTLSLIERVVFPQILPLAGTYTSKIIHKEIIEKVVLKSVEIEKYGVVAEGNAMRINKDGEVAVFEYEFLPIELTEITKGLKDLDTRAQIQEQQISLYEKFILNK